MLAGTRTFYSWNCGYELDIIPFRISFNACTTSYAKLNFKLLLYDPVLEVSCKYTSNNWTRDKGTSTLIRKS